MQKIQRDPSGAPAELVRALEDHHLGLRQLEVQQLRGRAGYCTIPGEAYVFRTVDDTPVEAKQRPSTSAEEIARVVWQVAKDTKRRLGGDPRFCARVVIAHDDGKKPEPAMLKFDVGVDDLLGEQHVASPLDVEANARATFTTELTSYAGAIHGLLAVQAERYQDVMTRSIEARTRADEAARDRSDRFFERMLDVVERALQIRFDAAEAEIAAAVREAKGAQSAAWKESGKNLLEVVKSPIGIAAAAQFLGLKPEEAAKLINAFGHEQQPQPEAAANAAPSTSTSIRPTLEKLVNSLTPAQRAKLLQAMGPALIHLQVAKDAADELTCRTSVVAFFDALGDESSPQWAAIEETLTESQSELVMRLMDRITEADEPEPPAA